MLHTLMFHAQIEDGQFTILVHAGVSGVSRLPGMHAVSPEHYKAEISWVDGVDVSLTCMFTKVLARWMEESGLEPIMT